MNGCHAPSWSVIMYNQIMASKNPIMFLHKVTDLLINLWVYRCPNQWLQRIFCDSDEKEETSETEEKEETSETEEKEETSETEEKEEKET